MPSRLGPRADGLVLVTGLEVERLEHEQLRVRLGLYVDAADERDHLALGDALDRVDEALAQNLLQRPAIVTHRFSATGVTKRLFTLQEPALEETHDKVTIHVGAGLGRPLPVAVFVQLHERVGDVPQLFPEADVGRVPCVWLHDRFHQTPGGSSNESGTIARNSHCCNTHCGNSYFRKCYCGYGHYRNGHCSRYYVQIDSKAESMREDEFLEALTALEEILEDHRRRSGLIKKRIAQIRRGRANGASYTEIVSNNNRPLIVQLLTESSIALDIGGSDVRRAEARALYAEGLTMEQIAERFGVTRQRVSALLRKANEPK